MTRDIKEPLPNWTPPPAPPANLVLTGSHVRLERLTASHAPALWQAFSHDPDGKNWDYLPVGPFATETAFTAWLTQTCVSTDPHFFAIIDLTTGQPTGFCSYLRITPAAGSIEVGYINFSPLLQATTGATEAMFLMMQWAFASGYRRYEWKCDAANLPSRRAAERFGFSYEGVFRQAMVVKGHNRDTAWFAVIDKEWPSLQKSFETWLSAENFTSGGQQITPLGALTTPIRVASDPAITE